LEKRDKKTNQEESKIMSNTKYISVLCWYNEKTDKHRWLVDICDSENSETIGSFKQETDAWEFAEEHAKEFGLEIKLD
jgi:hypothetical protein